LGRVLSKGKRYEEATPLLERALAATIYRRGHEHEDTLSVKTDLANVYKFNGQLDASEKLLNEVFECVKSGGSNQRLMVTTLINLVGIDEVCGRYDEAISKLQTLKKYLPAGQELDPNNKFVAMKAIGRFNRFLQRPAESIEPLESARELALSIFGEAHLNFSQACSELAEAYSEVGRRDDAEALFEDTHQRLLNKWGPNDHRVLMFSISMAQRLAETRDLERALTMARGAESVLARLYSGNTRFRAIALTTIGRCRYLAKRAAEAEPVLQEAMQLLKARKDDDKSWCHEAKIILGLVLVVQDRFAAAEPELIAGYQGLKEQDPRLTYSDRRLMREAVDALVQCAEKQIRRDDKSKWQLERERLKQPLIGLPNSRSPGKLDLPP
jgi:tetratricopeptide (TPR) repeat protein